MVFMMQENRTFDTYYGLLNPYRQANNFNAGDDGNTCNVDGIDDKLTKFTNEDDEGQPFGLFTFQSSCSDDETAAWLESYGRVSRYNFTRQRPIFMDGFCTHGRGFRQAGAGQWSIHRPARQARHGVLRSGLVELLLLHGVAVCTVRSLVQLASGTLTGVLAAGSRTVNRVVPSPACTSN